MLESVIMCAKSVTLILFLGFLFSNFDLHADFDGSSSANDDRCCVQCCPTHNLAPSLSIEKPRPSLMAFGESFIFDSSLYAEPFLSEIDPPPIFSVS